MVIAENNEVPERYLNAGVLGLIFRSVESAELLRCVRKVSLGEVYVQDSRTRLTMPTPTTLSAPGFATA